MNLLTSVYKPLHFTNEVTVDLKYFEEELIHNETNLNPPYQRGSVWTIEQQQAFMGHLIQGGEVLPLTFQRVPDCGSAEVLDGKQRCEAILAWLHNHIGARINGGSLLYRRDVTCGLASISVRFRYINLPYNERVDFYVRLNTAGSPHTPEQISAALATKTNG